MYDVHSDMATEVNDGGCCNDDGVKGKTKIYYH